MTFVGGSFMRGVIVGWVPPLTPPPLRKRPPPPDICLSGRGPTCLQRDQAPMPIAFLKLFVSIFFINLCFCGQ